VVSIFNVGIFAVIIYAAGRFELTSETVMYLRGLHIILFFIILAKVSVADLLTCKI